MRSRAIALREDPSRTRWLRLDWRRRALILQLLATVLVLGWIPGNGFKLGAMLGIWAVGFGRVTMPELLGVILVDLLFVAMDVSALRQGIFRFSRPDVLGLPAFEFFMWGFYILHAIRFFDEPGPRPRRLPLAAALAVLFSLPFLLIAKPGLLALAAATALAATLSVFREPLDFAYVVYMAVMGTTVEYAGVVSGQWSYPHSGFGPVPLWSFVMWAGIGLFTRRLFLPLFRSRATVHGEERIVPH